MSRSLQWKHLRTSFALRYELGYRYLDRCGELMILLEEQLGCIPVDQKPIGAKLEQPDLHLRIDLDTKELTIRQEQESPSDGEFASFCQAVSETILEQLEPATPFYSGFMSSTFLPFDTEDALHAATMVPDVVMVRTVGGLLGLTPQSQAFTQLFTSGSQELQVITQEVTLSANPGKLQSPGFKPTDRQAKAIERKNAAISRFSGAVSTFALLLEADLRERTPAVAQLTGQFALLQSYVSTLQQAFYPQSK